MSRFGPFVGSLLVVALIVGAPLGYASYRKHNLRNLRVVKEGVLLRSGQLSLAGLERVIHDYGVRTVVSLRDSYDNPGTNPPDATEEKFCRNLDLKYVRIPPRQWWSADGPAPADQGVRAFLEVMDDPANYPVLVHCFAGVHRTGAHVAVYRMEYEHWTNAQAIAEVRAFGYVNLDDEWDVLGYLEQYRPRWKSATRPDPAE